MSEVYPGSTAIACFDKLAAVRMRWPKVQVEPGQHWFDRRRNQNHVVLVLNRHSDGRWCVRRVSAQPYDFFISENALRNRFNPRLRERSVDEQEGRSG